mgnify:FL=1
MARNPFRNFNVYKIDPLSEIRNAGIVTNGEVFWVSSTADSDHRKRTDDLGNSVVKVSLQEAIDASASDRNDFILVIPTDGGTARRLGTAVDVNEDRLHILGVGYKPVSQSYSGLTFDGFAIASPNGNDTELVNVTGAGVEIGGLRFLGTSGTAALGTITATFRAGTAASGTPHDLWLHDLQIESNVTTAALGGTAPVFELTGDVATGIRSLRVDRCWIGNSSMGPTPVVNLVGTAGPARAEFQDCVFVMDAQATTDAFITGGTGNTEYILFKNCEFLNVESGTLNASAYSGVAGADTPVLFRGCSAVNVTQLGSGAQMYKSPAFTGTAAGIRDTGLAIGTAAILPA